jgi:diguanylate cyclase (GGDEF)-like protein
VSPTFLARQSCGCLEENYANLEFKIDDAALSADTFSSFVAKGCIPLFNDDIPQELLNEWFTNLIEIVKQEPFDKNNFIHLLNDILLKYSRYSQNYYTWREVLNILLMGVEHFHAEFKSMQSILSTFIFANTLIHDIRSREARMQAFAENDAQLLLRRIANNLLLKLDADSLAEELYEALPEAEINMVLVGLYGNNIRSGEPDADRNMAVLIGFDGEKKFNIKNVLRHPINFSDYATIEGFDLDRERRSIFFLPLFFEEEELGVLLLSCDSTKRIIAYENLRVSISTAMKGAQLLSRIQTLSVTDELTGLLNRRGFYEFAYNRLAQLQRRREGLPFVMFMDIDGLKIINDTYGHNDGDIAISAYAEMLKDSLREEDIIGRIGGDEFVVFSVLKSEEVGKQLEARVRAKFEEYNSKGLHPYRVAGSIGGVVLEAPTKKCLDEALLNADSLLYEEKQAKKKQGLTRQ